MVVVLSPRDFAIQSPIEQTRCVSVLQRAWGREQRRRNFGDWKAALLDRNGKQFFVSDETEGKGVHRVLDEDLHELYSRLKVFASS
mmetsp:Transcript_41047/g.162297  ORF Transcript_41047/g.162297 Transcript_41047/m.162297 type:complete len:86 (+) Transcript_41047:101-358(+)